MRGLNEPRIHEETVHKQYVVVPPYQSFIDSYLGCEGRAGRTSRSYNPVGKTRNCGRILVTISRWNPINRLPINFDHAINLFFPGEAFFDFLSSSIAQANAK